MFLCVFSGTKEADWESSSPATFIYLLYKHIHRKWKVPKQKNTNPRISIIKSITHQTKFIKIKIKAENVYDSKIIENLYETKSRPVIVQLDNEKYFPGKTNFFVFRSPMKCKEKINKERKKYTKRFILLRQLGILIFFSLIKQNKTMLESRWQWDILVFYSRSRDNWCGFVDVLFGDKGCEIVGEWGVVVLILVEQKGYSHFNFLYKRA